jgi:hypothetical protein
MTRGLFVQWIGYLMFLLLLTQLAAASCSAQLPRPGEETAASTEHESALHTVGSYVRTHKLPLLADAVTIFAVSADAASTVRIRALCPSCPDSGWLRSSHPSTPEVWAGTMSSAAVVVTINHLVYHHYQHRMDGRPDKLGQRFFIAVFTVPCVVNSVADVRDNAEVGRIANARKKLIVGSN